MASDRDRNLKPGVSRDFHTCMNDRIPPLSAALPEKTEMLKLHA
jgi:hypothetical protein